MASQEDTQPSTAIAVAVAGKPPMPESKPTLAIPQTDIIQAQLKQILTSLSTHRAETSDAFKASTETLAHLSANIELVSNDVGIVKDRVTILESWKNDQDVRATRTSTRIRQVSEQDVAQEAKLAQALMALDEERKKREALEANAATKADLAKVTDSQTAALVSHFDAARKSPVARIAFAIIATAITTYAASHGITIK